MNAQSNQVQKFDLQDRTARFGEKIILFCKKIPLNPVNQPIIVQLVKSGTSMGANYCEANNAESKKDFQHKIGIAKKEGEETKYWLQMVVVACPELKNEARILWQEAKELTLIFHASIQTSRKKL